MAEELPEKEAMSFDASDLTTIVEAFFLQGFRLETDLAFRTFPLRVGRGAMRVTAVLPENESGVSSTAAEMIFFWCPMDSQCVVCCVCGVRACEG